jgi:hypothetical protein
MTGVRLGACLAAAFALLTACGESQAGVIDPHRSLLITDGAVVADPERTVDPCAGAATLPVWSFGYLMQEMVAQRSDVTPQEFVRQWLALFRHGAERERPDGGAAEHRGRAAQAVRGDGIRPLADPVRLLAIVNRFDLRRGPLQVGETGGEVRFIFGAVDLTHDCHHGRASGHR